MGLTESGAGKDEERVVGAAWAFGYGATGGVGELIAAPHDKVGERVAGMELAVALAAHALASDRTDAFAVRSWGGKRQLGLLSGRKADFPILAQNFGHDSPKNGEVVFVDPIYEERVRDFEFNGVGSHAERLYRLEPGIECLL